MQTASSRFEHGSLCLSRTIITITPKVLFNRVKTFSDTNLYVFYQYVKVTVLLCGTCPVGWGCRIHRLLLCRGVNPLHNECPVNDAKQSDGEVPAMLELWGMWSTPLLPSLPGLLWPGVVAPDKGPIYGLNRTKWCLEFTVFIHLNCVYMLNWIVQNRTVLTLKLCTNPSVNCPK